MARRFLILTLATFLAACGSTHGSHSSATSSRSSGSSSSAAVPSSSASASGSSAVLSSTDGNAGRGAPCGARGGTTIAAGAVARVYSLGDAVYGCATGGRGEHLLGRRATCLREARVSAVAVSGELAAYALQRCGVDTGSAEVVVRRLTSGRQLRSVPATANRLAVESYQSVASLVLKADGSVAWISVGASIVRRRARDVEVRKADTHGLSLLDSSATTNPTSLRLAGSTISWQDAAMRRRAALS